MERLGAVKAAVNLLPEELRRVRRIPWRRLLAAAAVLALAGAGSAGASLLVSRMLAERAAVQADLDALSEERARLQADLNAVRELPRVKEEFARKRSFVEANREAREPWRLLDTVSRVLPRGMRVTDFGLDAEGRITIEGTAPSLVSVAAFMRGLEGGGRYLDPRVIFPDPFETADGAVVIRFRLSAAARGGGSGAAQPQP